MIAFKSFKSIALPRIFGPEKKDYDEKWLSLCTQRDHIAVLDSVRSLNIQTVGLWLYLPEMVENIAEIDLPNFEPMFSDELIKNWETLLDSAISRDIELFVTLFNVSASLRVQLANRAHTYSAWNNWIRAVRLFVDQYTYNRRLGKGVAAWIGLKEGPIQVFGNWQEAFYRSLQRMPHCQPVGIDMSYGQLSPNPWPPKNLLDIARRSCDFGCFHSYSDDPRLGDIKSWWGKPFAFGEVGAGITHTQPDPLGNAEAAIYSLGQYLSQGRDRGASTVTTWAWESRQIARWDGGSLGYVLGPVGEWLKDYQNDNMSLEIEGD